MALESDGTVTPTGTGVVPDPPASVTIEQTPGHPVGTGAVQGPEGPVTHEFGPLGQDGTGASPDPEPVTIDGPFAKVVRPSGRRAAESNSTAETTSPTQEQEPPAQQRVARTSPDQLLGPDSGR